MPQDFYSPFLGNLSSCAKEKETTVVVSEEIKR